MKILISGGSGLVGKELSSRLSDLGHEVGILTRKKKGLPSVKEYLWNDHFIEPEALENVDVLVHLAGAGIADKRWTAARKKEIIDSRVKTLRLISEKIKSCPVLVGASATGFYGGDRIEEPLNEDSNSGQDFLAECCRLWENEERAFAKKFNSRLVIIRTGLVLSSQEGVLPVMAAPVRWGIGANLGSGNQWISWIHISDLVNFYIQAAIDSDVLGIINGVSGEPVRHSEFNQAIAKSLNRKILLPNIPSAILKLAIGERAVLVLGSSQVLSQSSLPVQYTSLKKTLENLL